MAGRGWRDIVVWQAELWRHAAGRRSCCCRRRLGTTTTRLGSCRGCRPAAATAAACSVGSAPCGARCSHCLASLSLGARCAAAAAEVAHAAAAGLALHRGRRGCLGSFLSSSCSRGRRCGRLLLLFLFLRPPPCRLRVSLILCCRPSHGCLAVALALFLSFPPSSLCGLSLSGSSRLLCLAACGGCLALLACCLLGLAVAPPAAGCLLSWLCGGGGTLWGGATGAVLRFHTPLSRPVAAAGVRRCNGSAEVWQQSTVLATVMRCVASAAAGAGWKPLAPQSSHPAISPHILLIHTLCPFSKLLSLLALAGPRPAIRLISDESGLLSNQEAWTAHGCMQTSSPPQTCPLMRVGHAFCLRLKCKAASTTHRSSTACLKA